MFVISVHACVCVLLFVICFVGDIEEMSSEKEGGREGGGRQLDKEAQKERQRDRVKQRLFEVEMPSISCKNVYNFCFEAF